MTRSADIAEHLAMQALKVCRHYLPNGRRQGNYWVVGDVRNAPGRSMYVRLFSDGARRTAGRWTDAATGEHGDLLDIIREAIPCPTFSDVIAEAEAFIGRQPSLSRHRFRADAPRRSNHIRQARRLFCECVPAIGTLGETYLLNRAIDPVAGTGLRFHPACYCRPANFDMPNAWPAIIAPVTDATEGVTAVHRIYLDPNGLHGERLGKALLDAPKRSLGRIRSHAVRFGAPAPVIIVAEGIENALSVRTAFPDLTVHAALSAGNLAAYVPLPSTRRLVIALDNDDAGRRAARSLEDRAVASGLSVERLRPRLDDHNCDLRTFGLEAYRRSLLSQLAV